MAWEIKIFFFFKNRAEKEVGTQVPDVLLFFKKALYTVKESGQHFSFNLLW